MSIKFVEGNIFTYPGLDAICHGVNCKGIMGAGIAEEIRQKFPLMYNQYVMLCQNGHLRTGMVFVYPHFYGWESNFEEVKEAGLSAVYNLATQDYPGPCAKLEYIRKSVKVMIEDAEHQGIKTIGVPRLGAGIGGLDWNVVKRLLEELGSSTEVGLVVFEKFVR